VAKLQIRLADATIFDVNIVCAFAQADFTTLQIVQAGRTGWQFIGIIEAGDNVIGHTLTHVIDA